MMEKEKLCKCNNWASLDLMMMILCDHHENCEKRPSDREILKNVVTEFVRGIEAWSNDEDGVHPEVWEIYKKGKFFIGEPIKER